MPVEFDEYESEFDPTLSEGSDARRLLDYLREREDLGFTTDELSTRLELNRDHILMLLNELHDRQLVRYKAPYWAFGDDDRVGTYVASIASLQHHESDDEWEGWEEHAVDPRTARAQRNTSHHQ